jgi:hypothetical protein
MRRNIYEIFDDFRSATTKDAKLGILKQNWSPTLQLVLQLAYHPDIKWKVPGKYPENYVTPDTQPGISFATLDTELRRLYIFQEGNPTAEKLTPKKRDELLLIFLESLEPREADIVIGIFKKDLGVKGLTYKFIRDNIPGIVP